ncbi:MAG: prenyltransferase [Nitrososphaerales archaeon]
MPSRSLGDRLGLFIRFARVQFLPLVLAPLIVGTAAAWYASGTLHPLLLGLLFLGSASLLIASNSIDDVYDFVNGVDQVSEEMFPKEFPGWKPIPRGLMSVSQGLTISMAFYLLSLAVGVYLAVAVGWVALAVAVPGILLSYFYAAPPLKLDYRGLALGEVAIFLSFGPIPALGAFYVLTGGLTILPLLVSIPSGILTMNVVLTHDLIFYDSYKAAGKRSLAVVLGRVRTERLTFGTALAAYAFTIALIAAKVVPLQSLLVLLALPILLLRGLPSGSERPVPEYAKMTMRIFVHSVLFSVLFAVGLFL